MTRPSQYRFLIIAMLLSASVALQTAPDPGEAARAADPGPATHPALTKLPAFEATVRTPDGKPAVAAKVALVLGGSYVSLINGEHHQDFGVLHRCETDRSGRFQFGPREERFGLVITHPTGYAIFHPIPRSKHRWITLDPWTRIEGILQAGGKPVPNTLISIDRLGRLLRTAIEMPEMSVSETAWTDANGRFVFARVLSGSGTVSCQLPQKPGLLEARLRSTQSIQTNFPIGETLHLEFGRHCRTVVGKLRAPPDLKMRPDWSRAIIELHGDNTTGDRPTRDFKGAPEKDGSFRIDNMPPGRWTLSFDYINYSRENQWRLYLHHRLWVSEPDDESSSQPLDLKVLTLEAK
jgi:hypothetical protein